MLHMKSRTGSEIPAARSAAWLTSNRLSGSLLVCIEHARAHHRSRMFASRCMAASVAGVRARVEHGCGTLYDHCPRSLAGSVGRERGLARWVDITLGWANLSPRANSTRANSTRATPRLEMGGLQCGVCRFGDSKDSDFVAPSADCVLLFSCKEFRGRNGVLAKMETMSTDMQMPMASAYCMKCRRCTWLSRPDNDITRDWILDRDYGGGVRVGRPVGAR